MQGKVRVSPAPSSPARSTTPAIGLSENGVYRYKYFDISQRKMEDLDTLTTEAQRVLMGKLEYETVYMRVYILSKGEVFPEMKAKFDQLWTECVMKAANTLGYI